MKKIMKKSIVVGLGEVGSPMHKLLSKKTITIGYDVDQKLMNQKKFKRYENYKTLFLHICIPFSKKFMPNVQRLIKKFEPEIVVIHSTISPNTTTTLQSKLKIPVLYSPTRGVHKRMLYDLKRYTKFFTIPSNAPKKKFAVNEFIKIMKQAGIKTKKISKPETLELEKIFPSYYMKSIISNYDYSTNHVILNSMDGNILFQDAYIQI